MKPLTWDEAEKIVQNANLPGDAALTYAAEDPSFVSVFGWLVYVQIERSTRYEIDKMALNVAIDTYRQRHVKRLTELKQEGQIR